MLTHPTKKRQKKYGTLLNEIGAFYKTKRDRAEYELTLRYFLFSYPASSAYTLYKASIERGKKDMDRDSAYMDRNFDRTKQRLTIRMNNYHEPFEKIALKEIIHHPRGDGFQTRDRDCVFRLYTWTPENAHTSP